MAGPARQPRLDARRRHGLTQAQLAARARTSQAAISRIERGLVSPSVSTLATLLDLLGEELELAARPADYGYDRTLIENNLRMTLEQRLDQAANFAEFIGRAQAQIRAQQAVRP
jgi:transcriptional regulator with XRE-family HTH domain